MKKIFTLKRVICIVLAVIGFAGVLASIAYIDSDGTDFTEEYNLYKDVNSISDIDAIRNKLQELKLEYTITKDEITIQKSDCVSFKVIGDTCQINPNTAMQAFSKIDSENLSDVKIIGKKENGKIVEKLIIIADGDVYTKAHNNYYFSNSDAFGLLLLFVILMAFATSILVFDFVNKNKKNKQADNMGSGTDY